MVERSLRSVYERRQSREWKRKLSVAEKRAQHLMNISRFPIAIIKEGVYIYANDACASMLGFSDSEEMLCLPVIDNICKQDREKLKAYMVPLESTGEIMPFDAAIKTVDVDGAESDAYLEIHQIQYDAEPALQFTINKDKLFDASMDTSEQSQTTEYSAIQPHLVYELISRGTSHSVQSGQDCMLLNIQVDRFSQLKEDLGIAKAEKIAHSLVMFIVQQFEDKIDCGRISENCFVMVLPDTPEEQIVELAVGICRQVGEQVFDIDDETFSLITSIGITGLNENVPSVEHGLERSEEAISQLRQNSTEGTSEGGNGAKFYIPDIHSDDISKADAVVITAKKLLSKDAFSIRYQPIVALIDGGSGKEYYEVILGIKSDIAASEIPEDFITNLFKSEIAAEVDRWVINQALSSLTDKLKSNPETQLFINISTQSFADSGFLPWLQKTLADSKLPANALIFQFREIDAVRYLNQAAALCDEMKNAQGQVGISNFGLAINPLKTLERIKADFVKVDPLIVEKLANEGKRKGDQGREEFQKLMAGMTGTGVDVIVPFVETATIIPILWQQGGQYIQGHYIDQPAFTMDYDFSEGP